MEIKRADPADVDHLTEIAFAAKRMWGYPEAWIELWTDDLTVDAAYVRTADIWKAITYDGIVGWCAVAVSENLVWIEHLWVLPESQGSGIGSTLVRRALEPWRGQTVRVISDPNAEGFYQRLGFRRIGEKPSRPSPRRLPVLERLA